LGSEGLTWGNESGVFLPCCADSTEFCPLEEMEDFFVCGSYQLDQETRIKSGKLHLFQVANDGVSMKHLQHMERLAILDLKWYSLCKIWLILLVEEFPSVKWCGCPWRSCYRWMLERIHGGH
jgi:hypothetical protein